MKRRTAILGVAATVAVAGLFAPLSARADSYGLSFGYRSGGPRHGGHWGPHSYYRGGRSYCRPSYSFGFSYYRPPVYYAPPRPPPPVVYRSSPPVYYYSGGSFYCY